MRTTSSTSACLVQQNGTQERKREASKMEWAPGAGAAVHQSRWHDMWFNSWSKSWTQAALRCHPNLTQLSPWVPDRQAFIVCRGRGKETLAIVISKLQVWLGCSCLDCMVMDCNASLNFKGLKQAATLSTLSWLSSDPGWIRAWEMSVLPA